MKHLNAFCLVVALTSCAAHPSRTTKCPPAHFTYVGTERVDGLTYGASRSPTMLISRFSCGWMRDAG